MTKEKAAEPEPGDMGFAYVVLYRRDFYGQAKILYVCTSEKTAEHFAWEEAKRRFRYTGTPRWDYTFFDQAIRIDQVPLYN